MPAADKRLPVSAAPLESELGRELKRVWEEIDALGERPLTLDELQREALDDAG